MKQYDLAFQEEVVMFHNPKGGRPMAIGQTTFLQEGDAEVSEIREESQIRYHLGYCTCSRAIKVGHKKALVLASMLEKKGIKPIRVKRSLRLRLLRTLLPHVPVDIYRNTA